MIMNHDWSALCARHKPSRQLIHSAHLVQKAPKENEGEPNKMPMSSSLWLLPWVSNYVTGI